jgi:hypothetical protein
MPYLLAATEYKAVPLDFNSAPRIHQVTVMRISTPAILIHTMTEFLALKDHPCLNDKDMHKTHFQVFPIYCIIHVPIRDETLDHYTYVGIDLRLLHSQIGRLLHDSHVAWDRLSEIKLDIPWIARDCM